MQGWGYPALPLGLCGQWEVQVSSSSLEELIPSTDRLENVALPDPSALQIERLDQDRDEKYHYSHPQRSFQHKSFDMTHRA